MKFKPIEKPLLVGCLTCSPVPAKTLNKNTIIDTTADSMEINGVCTWIGEVEQFFSLPIQAEITIYELEEMLKDVIPKVDAITIEFESALHSEKYELNKEDGEWYLIEQGMGWA